MANCDDAHVTARFRRRDTRHNVAKSFAMEAASNTKTCFYRSGYDMSVPLTAKHPHTELASVPPLERKFFLTIQVPSRLSM